MSFKSQAQRRFMFSQKPELAKEFASKTPDIKSLPEKVSLKSRLAPRIKQ